MHAHAQQVPPSADVGRVDENIERKPLPFEAPELQRIPTIQPSAKPPANAYGIKLTLKTVEVHGATAFSDSDFEPFYEEFLGKEVPLSTLWEIAQRITNFYQKKGYFLSRAYVPEQEIESGNVRINVVEGYIGRVEGVEDLRDHRLVRGEIQHITQQIPLKRQDLETMLLKLNDLPGYVFDALLKPSENRGNQGEVVLFLEANETTPRLQASIDNYGSEFLGPTQLSLGLQTAFLPYQKTALNMTHSIPEDELVTASIRHEIPLKPNTKVNLRGSVTHTDPGENLAANDVLGDSIAWGVGVEHYLLRQRRKNLNLFADFDARNSETDLLGSPLVRDRTRTVSLGLKGDLTDRTGALNQGSVTLNKGLGLLNASDKGDANLSRAQADPNHFKVEGTYLRQQPVTQNILMQLTAEGQWSPDSLVSSEEFGFGGPRLGRAFDASEISGDSGFGAGLEMHYLGLNTGLPVRAIPYGFVDIGRVWNEEPGRDSETASSFGGGARLLYETESKLRLYADIYAAQPLIKRQNNPLMGDGKAPRIGFRIGLLK